MALYLFGTQCLFELGLYDGGPVHRWFEARSAQQGLFADDVVISAFVLATAMCGNHGFPFIAAACPRSDAGDLCAGRLDRWLDVAADDDPAELLRSHLSDASYHAKAIILFTWKKGQGPCCFDILDRTGRWEP